jgi:hypothetical protein
VNFNFSIFLEFLQFFFLKFSWFNWFSVGSARVKGTGRVLFSYFPCRVGSDFHGLGLRMGRGGLGRV